MGLPFFRFRRRRPVHTDRGAVTRILYQALTAALNWAPGVNFGALQAAILI